MKVRINLPYTTYEIDSYTLNYYMSKGMSLEEIYFYVYRPEPKERTLRGPDTKTKKCQD